jgi:hypothetical protein
MLSPHLLQTKYKKINNKLFTSENECLNILKNFPNMWIT